MAVLTSSSPNIVDLMKELDPDGQLARMANLLAQTNQMLTMMPYVRANNKTHHRVTAITKLPEVTERALNEGTLATKHETTQHDEAITMLDNWAVCDVDLANLSGNPAEYRGRRVRTGIEAMNQRGQFLTVYGNQATAPKQFTGLMPRLNAIGDQVIDGGAAVGQTDCTSIYMVCASPETAYYIYPDGSTGGLQHIDHGIDIEQNQNGVTGAQMAAFKDQLKWHFGLAIEDQRCIIRIANIDTSELTGLSGAQAPTSFTNVAHKMQIAIDRLPIGMGGDKFFIANRTARTGFTRMMMEKSTNAVTVREAFSQFGRPMNQLYFMEYPILLVDQITNGESQIS